MSTSTLTNGLHAGFSGSFGYGPNPPPVNPQVFLSDGNDNTYMTLSGNGAFVNYTLSDTDPNMTLVTGVTIRVRMKENSSLPFPELQNKLWYVQILKSDGITPITSQCTATSTETLTTYNFVPSSIYFTDKTSWDGALLRLRQTQNGVGPAGGGTTWTDVSVIITWKSMYYERPTGAGFKFGGTADFIGGGVYYDMPTTGFGFVFGGSASDTTTRIFEYLPTGEGFVYGGSAATDQDSSTGEGFLFSGSADVETIVYSEVNDSYGGSGYGYDGIYQRILILELIEKTKNCLVTWDEFSPTVYKTEWNIKNRYYEVSVTYLRNNYRVDFVRNNRSVLNIDSGDVPEVLDLFRIVGIYLGQDDVSTLIPAVQNQIACNEEI